MIKRTLKLLKNSIYILFSIVLLSNCSSNAPGKDSSVSATGDGLSKNIPKIETSVIDNSKPHVYTISIEGMKFHPEKIEVHKGDTIIWMNHDLVNHCVTEIHKKGWTSSAISSGGSWKMAVTESSDYYCAIHPVMKGKIVMK